MALNPEHTSRAQAHEVVCNECGGQIFLGASEGVWLHADPAGDEQDGYDLDADHVVIPDIDL
jgi:hypothetical protein